MSRFFFTHARFQNEINAIQRSYGRWLIANYLGVKRKGHVEPGKGGESDQCHMVGQHVMCYSYPSDYFDDGGGLQGPPVSHRCKGSSGSWQGGDTTSAAGGGDGRWWSGGR